MQLPPVTHELQKARVVHGGGHQAASSTFHGHVAARVQHPHRHTAIRVMHKGFGNAAMRSIGHRKTGLMHAQWREDAVPQVLAQGLATDHLNQPAQHVRGAAVSPDTARLVHQRQPAQRLRKLCVAAVARANLQRRVLTLHLGDAKKLIGQAGRMAQQVLHRGWPDDTLKLNPALTLYRNFLPCVFGQKLFHRIAQQKFALLHQHHHRDRHHRFGHGVDAKNGVACHHTTGCRVLLAKAFEQGHLAAADYQRDRTRQTPAVNVGLQHRQHVLQAVRTQTDLRRGRKIKGERGRPHHAL